MSNTETETQKTQESKSKGGRPKNPPPPTTAAEVRSLMATEVVRAAPDKDRLRFLGELLVSFEGVEARAETAASKLLPATLAERDTLLARVNELEPLAAQLPDMTAQYNALKTDFNTRIAAMRAATFLGRPTSGECGHFETPRGRQQDCQLRMERTPCDFGRPDRPPFSADARLLGDACDDAERILGVMGLESDQGKGLHRF
jgi:hypothetical protein